MIKAIFMDMDDTLIVNQVLYEYATAMLQGYLRNHGVDAAQVQQTLLAKDKELFPSFGYSRHRYPQSFENTLLHFVPDADEKMVTDVRALADTVFTTVAKVKPDVAEALEMLESVAPLYIVTAGPQDVQGFRVEHLPFKDKFTGIHIVDAKNKDVFAGILAQYDLKPEEAVMIGDSLKSDVLSATAAGMRAVWIEAHNSQHEKAVIEGLPAGAHKFSSLLECARHLSKDGIAPVNAPAPAANENKPQAKKGLRRFFPGN